MPKFTYPIVFIFNETEEWYHGYLPDLGLYTNGAQLEDVYGDAEETLKDYFKILTQEGFEVPQATSLEDISKKWKGYKVSLMTANLPD